jgi:antitoxin MazE
MITKLQKWGNSQGLRISKQQLEAARLSVGDEVEVEVQDGVITVSPAKCVRGRYDLRELVVRIPKDYEAEEIDWGPPVGKEVW